MLCKGKGVKRKLGSFMRMEFFKCESFYIVCLGSKSHSFTSHDSYLLVSIVFPN